MNEPTSINTLPSLPNIFSLHLFLLLLKISPFFLSDLDSAFWNDKRIPALKCCNKEHRISYDGGEATPESLKKVKPEKSPDRGLSIAEYEKLGREESQKRFSRGTELVFHPFFPASEHDRPLIPRFDPRFPLGFYVENFPMLRSQLLDSSQPVSSDGTMPLLWTSFQSDTSS